MTSLSLPFPSLSLWRLWTLANLSRRYFQVLSFTVFIIVCPRTRITTNLINLKIRYQFSKFSAQSHRSTRWDRSTCYIARLRRLVTKVACYCLSFTKEQWTAGRKGRGISSSPRRKGKRDGTFPDARSYGFFLSEVLYSVGRRHRGVWFIRTRSSGGFDFLLPFLF